MNKIDTIMNEWRANQAIRKGSVGTVVGIKKASPNGRPDTFYFFKFPGEDFLVRDSVGGANFSPLLQLKKGDRVRSKGGYVQASGTDPDFGNYVQAFNFSFDKV